VSRYCTYRWYEGGRGLLLSSLLPVQTFKEWVGHHVCYCLQALVFIRVKQLETRRKTVTSPSHLMPQLPHKAHWLHVGGTRCYRYLTTESSHKAWTHHFEDITGVVVPASRGWWTGVLQLGVDVTVAHMPIDGEWSLEKQYHV